MYIIGLSGGSGTRLWPYSHKEKPKQFIKLPSGKTVLTNSFGIYEGLSRLENYFIVTSQKYQPQVCESIKQISPLLENQVLVEPDSKSTLPALAYAIRHLLVTKKAKKSDVILVAPTDHIFSNGKYLRQCIQKAELFAEDGKIVSFGVSPQKADSGFGYIRRANELEKDFFTVDSFIEKPELPLAEKFVKNEDWLWNTGLYLFSIETFLDEVQKNAPEIAHFMKVESHHEDYVFRALSPISIDTGLIEKCVGMVTCKLSDTAWTDIGSWESLYEIFDKDSRGNVKEGPVEIRDSCNNLIIAEDKPITVLGLDDLIVVDAPETIFIAKRENAGDLQKLIDELKTRKTHSDEAVEKT